MEQIIELLKSRESFVIAGHTAPDGDTIGSCLGLAMALGKLGKKVVVVLEPYAAKYRVIPGRKYLCRSSLETLKVDVFIALDCADTERLSAARALFDRAQTTVCIDHHETNAGFAKYNFIDPGASSTAEMVFGVIEALSPVIASGAKQSNLIDADIATAIYAGIVGDTGGFRYMSTGRSTMEVAARLMDTGIPFTDIYREMLLGHSFEAAKAFGLALGAAGQAMGGRIVYTHMTREMLVATGVDSSDMDSVVEYLMNTKGADVALFLYERHQSAKDAGAPEATSVDTARQHESVEERSDAATQAWISSAPPREDDSDTSSMTTQRKIKVSMRSRGLHVGQIAASLGGGGHRLAAGCTMVGTIEDIMRQVLEILELELKAGDLC